MRRPRRSVPRVSQYLVPLLWAIFIAPASVAGEGPGTKNGESGIVSFRAAACGSCHRRVYDEWIESWMARAFSNATFQAEYARERAFESQSSTTTARFCLRCHAPLGFLYEDVAGERTETSEGVSCDFCHRVAQIRERIADVHVPVLDLSGTIYGPFGGIDSPAHPTRLGTAFADSRLCAICHLDFSASGTPLERTYQEWKRSDFAKRGVHCADCHMPQREGPATDVPGLVPRRSTHASHRFHGGHARSPLLQSAARVEVVSADASRGLEIRVRNSTVGHNFPTAGAHPNELSLEIEIIGSDGDVLRREVRVYRFSSPNAGDHETTSDKPVISILDTTLGPLEVRIENFPAALLRGGVRGTVQLVYRLIPEEIGLQWLQLAESFFTENYRPVVIDKASFQVTHPKETTRSIDPRK